MKGIYFYVLVIFATATFGRDKFALYPSLDHFHWKTSTSSSEAQEYFDQGMALYYGFNHEAAILSFEEAIKLDSTFAMAYWGKALSAGPNINNPFMDSTASRNAWEAANKAFFWSKNTPGVEHDLAEAVVQRYVWPQPEDRKSLDVAYADAMRKVWEKHPANMEAGTLFADAMMNLRPWDLWKPTGEAQPGTLEIVATLEKVLSLQPRHPGANHFYIHTMEASPEPGKALTAANTLGALIPGAGHLVHMPSHIYIRLGMYDEAVRSNEEAILADTTWAPFGGFYTIYRAHNYHFLAYGAMFDGRKAIAMKAARDMIEQIPIELVRMFPDFLDAYLAVPIHVMVRFGMWEDILKQPAPPSDMTVTTAGWHYGRTVALSALGRVAEAQAAFDSLNAAYANVQDSRLLGNNPAKTVMQIGLKIAEGELEYRKGNFKQAFALLEEAVIKDDSLKYDEPWGWMMPARHGLGALLLEQGELAKAEEVYREDLRLHPNNGWALKGLHSAQVRAGKKQAAMATQSAFNKAWSRSDITIKASCYCSRDAMKKAD